jgi:hypothetical protein
MTRMIDDGTLLIIISRVPSSIVHFQVMQSRDKLIWQQVVQVYFILGVELGM